MRRKTLADRVIESKITAKEIQNELDNLLVGKEKLTVKINPKAKESK